MKKLLALIMLLSSYIAIAAPNKQVFPISTEFQIGKIEHIVKKVPKDGIYLTIGSERGFRGASMSPNINSLILVDISDVIVRFNLINAELLKAPNKEAYKKLRWSSNFSEWTKTSGKLTKEDFTWWENKVRNLKNMNYPLPEELNKYGSALYNKKFVDITNKLKLAFRSKYPKNKSDKSEQNFIQNVSLPELEKIIKKYNIEVTITANEWEWWTKVGKNKKNDCSKNLLENYEQVVDLGQVINYKRGNYLFDEVLYQKLHNLAMNGKITVVKANLIDQNDFVKVVSVLKASKSKISVLDLDNLFHPDYIGEEAYKELVQKLLPYGTDKSMLIVMNNYKNFGCGQFQIYLGFTFENIHTWPPYFLFQTFFEAMPGNILDLVDGNIYEKGDLPPMEYIVNKR